VGGLRRLSKSLAILDAILCPEWQYRYHSYNANWAAGEEMASMRDGCGDSYIILFSGAGAIIKGFAHESEVWRRTPDWERPFPGVFDGVPEEFAGFLTEPAFSIDETTFCLWRRHSDSNWRTGADSLLGSEDPDGSADLLRLLDGDAERYKVWAEDYFETPIASEAVNYIFAYHPLTEKTVRALNPTLSLNDVAEDVSEIAYPTPS
jgi:hypothetical protein